MYGNPGILQGYDMMSVKKRVSVPRQSPVYIITGDPGEGKTTFLIDMVASLKRNDMRICGFVAPGYFREGVRSGFSLTDLEAGATQELCSSIPAPGSEKHGRFYFHKAGLEFGYRSLVPALIPGNADLAVIDEVGWFELNGSVWSACLDTLVNSFHPPMLWTVRRTLIDEVISHWEIQRPVVIDPAMVHKGSIINDILIEIKGYRDITSA